MLKTANEKPANVMKVRYTGVEKEEATEKIFRTVYVKPTTTEAQLRQLQEVFLSLGVEKIMKTIVATVEKTIDPK